MARQVAVFLDLDNIYWGLSNFYGPNTEEMIMQIIDKIWDTYKDDKVRIFSAYADFERIPRIQTEIQRKRVTTKHVFGNQHRNDMVRNAIDLLELCLNKDCLATALTEDKHEKVIVPMAVEQVIFEAVAQITSICKVRNTLWDLNLH